MRNWDVPVVGKRTSRGKRIACLLHSSSTAKHLLDGPHPTNSTEYFWASTLGVAHSSPPGVTQALLGAWGLQNSPTGTLGLPGSPIPHCLLHSFKPALIAVAFLSTLSAGQSSEAEFQPRPHHVILLRCSIRIFSGNTVLVRGPL